MTSTNIGMLVENLEGLQDMTLSFKRDIILRKLKVTANAVSVFRNAQEESNHVQLFKYKSKPIRSVSESS